MMYWKSYYLIGTQGCNNSNCDHKEELDSLKKQLEETNMKLEDFREETNKKLDMLINLVRMKKEIGDPDSPSPLKV